MQKLIKNTRKTTHLLKDVLNVERTTLRVQTKYTCTHDSFHTLIQLILLLYDRDYRTSGAVKNVENSFKYSIQFF